MAEGYGPTAALAILNYLGGNANAVTFTGYVQLHTAAPGAAGTANVAGNEVRKAVSFGAATGPSGGFCQVANDAQISWSTTDVDTAEDYTHFTLWDALAAGNFMASGAVVGNPVIVGDEAYFAVGAFVLRLPVAS